MARVRIDERPPLRLAATITTAGGHKYRWGSDEDLAENVPQDVTFSTAIPGGHDQATCSLARSDKTDYADLGLLDDIEIYGPGGQTAWKGRLAEFPFQHGDDLQIKPAAVGYSAHLKDDPSFREIYVDLDFSHWGNPSVQMESNQRATGLGRKVTSAAAVITASPDVTQGQAALETLVEQPWSATSLPICIGHYTANGIVIGSLYYAWKKNNIAEADTNWEWGAGLTTADDSPLADDWSGNLRAAGPGTGTLTATTSTRKFANVYLYYAVATANDGAQHCIYWTRLAIYGNHGLTKQGSESATSAKGFYASDVIADIVSRAAPLLTYSTGSGGSIQQTAYVIPHLVIGYDQGVTAEEAIRQANRFELYDWAVYDSPSAPYGEFLYAPSGSLKGKRTWHLRLSDGVHKEDEGPQAEDSFNGCVVYYTDATTQTTKSVGPAGSGADTTDSSLADTSSTNPVNAHGISKRYLTLDNVGLLSSSGAIQLGSIALTESQRRNVRGSCAVKGWATTDAGVTYPAWMIRAGDSCRFMDSSDTSARKIIGTSYSHQNVTNTLTLDALPNRLTALIERIQAEQVGRV